MHELKMYKTSPFDLAQLTLVGFVGKDCSAKRYVIFVTGLSTCYTEASVESSLSRTVPHRI